MGSLQRRITGRFLEPLESEFMGEYKQRTLRFVRMGLGVAVFLYLASNAWDYTVDPRNAWMTGYIRAAVSLALVATLALTFNPPWFFRVDQLVMGANCVLAGAALLVVVIILEGGRQYAVSCMLLVFMFVFGFVRLLFATALIASLLITLIYNATLIFVGESFLSLLSNNYLLLCGIVIGASTTRLVEGTSRRHFLTRKALEAEKSRADNLILSIFPSPIAKRLEAGERIIAESHGEGTVLFADLVGFSSLARRMSPTHLVEVLNDIFSIMDLLTEKHRVEKIKTIGDAYMAASGVTMKVVNSAEPIADFALDLVDEIATYAKAHNYPIAVRVGLSTGQIVSGVIGSKKPSFDLWGDTINLANRMEIHGEAGCIQVNETAYWRLQEKYRLDKRGTVSVKGIGEVEAYFLRGKKQAHLRVIERDAAAGPAALE
jgi:class 3 adenylate cyclase